MSGARLLTRQTGQTAWLRHQHPQDRIWRLIDCKDQVLGRVAAQAARLLQGRHKPTYLDNMNSGDHVVVINLSKIVLTGRKSRNKLYRHHTGYPGGLKEVSIEQVMKKRPETVLRRAVHGMLPANRLRAVWLANLRIYMGEDHPHEAQKPVPLAPAHCGARIGGGGPPTREELGTWWLDCIEGESRGEMERIVDEARQERASARGLAEVLRWEGVEEADVSEANMQIRRRYVEEAMRDLAGEAVVMPSAFA